MFSKTAGYLRTHNATDRNAVLQSIKQGFTPNWGTHEVKAYVKNLDRAADISGWLKAYLAKIPHVTDFRQFEIEKDTDGEVVVRARQRCMDDEVYNKWTSLKWSCRRSDQGRCGFGWFVFGFEKEDIYFFVSSKQNVLGVCQHAYCLISSQLGMRSNQLHQAIHQLSTWYGLNELSKAHSKLLMVIADL